MATRKRLFLSYARVDRPAVQAIADDLRTWGCDVFFDEQIEGGKRWWDQILTQIEECEGFLPVLSRAYLGSQPCHLEAAYANSVDKPFLPIALEPVSASLYPDYIAETEWVTYRSADRDALMKLLRGVQDLEPCPALPSTMPARPAVPITYMTHVKERLASPDDLTRAEQMLLLSEVREALAGSDPAAAHELLQMFQARRDLTVHVAREVDALAADHERAEHRERRHRVVPKAAATRPPADSVPRRVETTGGDAGAFTVHAPNERRKRMLIAIGVGVMVVALVAAIAIGARNGGNGRRSTGPSTTALNASAVKLRVPSVVGANVDAAKARLARAGFKLKVVGVASGKAAGTVVDQSPPAGTTSTTGSIVLEISQGSRTVALPYVVGLSYTTAASILEHAGFKLSAGAAAISNLPAGYVVTTDPTGAASAGSSIVLVISEGATSGQSSALSSQYKYVAPPNVGTSVTTSADTTPTTQGSTGGTVEQPPATTPPQLEIVSARFENACDPTQFADVTSTIRGMIKDNRVSLTNVQANQYDNLFGDPAPYHHKKLQITWSLGGTTQTSYYDEDTEIEVPTTASATGADPGCS